MEEAEKNMTHFITLYKGRKSLEVEVIILEERNSMFGRQEYLVTPKSGSDEIWVTEHTLKNVPTNRKSKDV